MAPNVTTKMRMRLSVRVPRRLFLRLRAMARDEGVPLAAFIRRLLGREATR